MRCAIYARYSSDLQREASIEDQVRKCRELALLRGWTVLADYVVCDQAVSGASLAKRDALNGLVAAAKRKPRPFDRILVDDTSRLARNIGDGLHIMEMLRFHGVLVSAVSQGLDSEQKSARQLLTLHGMMDEQFLVSLADKVHRGQEGRALKGLIPGGKCFGYRNMPIEDPTRPAKYGRPAVSGVRLEIDQDQATVVKRIFEMHASGKSLSKIAKQLNAEGVQSPQPARGRRERSWCITAVYAMLRNERYRGVQVWNRTHKERNPETGRKTSRPCPESEWIRTEVPEWRIISEELWAASQARARLSRERFGAPTVVGGGGRRFLFSGLLICGECGAKMAATGGSGLRSAVSRYGCPSHRYRGTCSNRLTIRQDRLEAQLLFGLETRVLSPVSIEYAISKFQEKLEQRLADLEKEADGFGSKMGKLQQERSSLASESSRIADAIAAIGHSPSLLSRLAQTESKLAEVDAQLSVLRPPEIKVAIQEIRDFVTGNLLNLREMANQDTDLVRTRLLKHVQEIVLTPAESDSGPAFAVSGAWSLLPQSVQMGSVVTVVARDGIECSNTTPMIPISGWMLDPKVLVAAPQTQQIEVLTWSNTQNMPN